MKKTPLLAGFLFWSLIGFGQVDVLTYHYDNARTGQNIQETILTPTNVKQDFGKLFSQLVDGDVYAQPLYVHNVAIPGKGTHNVVFVATEADSVYAFDADYYNGGKYLWKATLLDQAHGPAGPTRAGLVVRPPYRGLGVHGWRTPAP